MIEQRSQTRSSWGSSVAEAQSERGEDRLEVVVFPDRLIAIVADGAGGVSGGVQAAEILCHELRACIDVVRWDAWLTEIDRRMVTMPSCGLAAAVVFEIRNDGVVTGASVGDCEAWFFGSGAPKSLTSKQRRKPFLGSGEAIPTPFAAELSKGTSLVAGSDGLWKYAKQSLIREAVSVRPLELASTSLIDAARLKNGKLQDDVAVFIYNAEEK